MKKILLLTSLLPLLTSCAHYPDVRPGESGVHTVIIGTERKGDGFQEAWSQAKDYCDDVYKQRPVRLTEKSEYIGSMDESTYNASKTGLKVIEGVGTATAIFGGKKESKAGAAAGVGAGIGDGAMGKGYQMTVTFKCK